MPVEFIWFLYDRGIVFFGYDGIMHMEHCFLM